MQSETRNADAFSIEAYGIDPIPENERWARPLDVFGMVFGGGNSVSTALLGTFPVLFGLSFWDGALAILLGVAIGSIILMPMALFGPVNGTNNAVSSSGHFGAHGRLLGSLLALLGAFTFLALAVWASGDALLASVARLSGFTVSDFASAITYLIMTALLIVICVFGYRLLVLMNRYVPPLVAMLFLVGIVAYATAPGFSEIVRAGADNRWQDPVYVASFFGSMLIAMSCPISYGPFLGDYSRYVSPRLSKSRLMGSVFWAQIACLVPFFFGHITASSVAVTNPEAIASGDYVGGLIGTAPGWFFAPLALISVAGGITTGTSLLYGTGLDFSSIVTRLSRVSATLLIGAVTLVFVLVGKFVFNVVQSVTTLSTLLVICTVPWIVIMLIGYATRRGWYDSDALQIFNRRQHGGRYWYVHGWNTAAMAAWVISAGMALAFVNIPGQFVGPFAEVAGGVDISLIVGLCLAAVLYLGMLFIWPERRFLYGPKGPRWVPVREGGEIPPITNIRH